MLRCVFQATLESMLQLFNSKRISGVNAGTIMFTVFFLLFLYFLYMIMDILTLLFLAFILMVAINPVAKKINRYIKIGRTPSILLAYVLLITLLVGFLSILIPPLVNQLGGLMGFVDVPFVQSHLSDFKFSLTELSSIASQIGTSVNALWSIIGNTFSTIFTLFTLFVISFFMLQERSDLHKKMSWLVKSTEEVERFKKTIDTVEEELGGWVRGQLILMLVVGLLTFFGLTLLGVPYAVPLALLAGLLEILPNIGPTIAAIPAITVAYLTLGPVMAGAVLILNLIVQQLENNLLVPHIMKASADVNPLASIVVILIGLKLGGVVGALLAVPLYILIRTIYSIYFYKHRI